MERFHNKYVKRLSVQDEMTSALVSFAYTGDPSSELLPWAAFTIENGETMVFDDVSQVINYPDEKLIVLIQEATPDSSGSDASEAEEAESAEGESEEGESPEGDSTEAETQEDESPATESTTAE